MLHTRVVNVRRDEYDVYIGRGSMWGNPYTHMPIKETRAKYQVLTRQEAITRYEEYIRSSPSLLAKLPLLVGKRLGCYCAPLPCHGDILIEIIREKGLE